MANVFRLEVFPAQRGDSILVEYGDDNAPKRMLVDGGITRTAREHLVDRLSAMGDDAHIDCLVITHIDQDHIQGVVELLNTLPPNVSIDRVWFNGEKHLPFQPQGVNDALALAELLEGAHKSAWDAGTGDEAICLDADGTPWEEELPGGLKLTLLSPDAGKLETLAHEWAKVVEEMGVEDEETIAARVEAQENEFPGLEPMGTEEVDVTTLAESDFEEDTAAPNGSSIAFPAEYAGKSVVFLADAHPSLVLSSLQKLSPDAPLQVDCVKLSHHGSRKNTSLELARHLVSPRWIISSNGAQTKHPNTEAIARVLHGSPGEKTIYFNYRTPFNEMWDDTHLQATHGYQTVYGDGTAAVLIDMLE